jgi:hypothetical protein
MKKRYNLNETKSKSKHKLELNTMKIKTNTTTHRRKATSEVVKRPTSTVKPLLFRI